MSHLTPEDITKVNLEMMNHWLVVGRDRARAVLELGMMGLRTLILLNGGAIIALIALLGHTVGIKVDQHRMALSLASYAGGASLALLAVLFGYLGQNSFMMAEMTLGNRLYYQVVGMPEQAPPPMTVVWGRASWFAAIGVAVAGWIAFLLGCWLAFNSIDVANVLPSAS